VLLESESGRGIECATDADSRVDHEARDVAPEVEGMALENVVTDGLMYPRLPKKFVTPVRTGRGVTLT